MKLLSTWTLAAATAIATLACETSTSTTPDIETAGGTWELISLDTPSGAITVPDPAKYTLELTEDGNAHIVADCNVCNGSYDLSGVNLTMGLMACTRAACAPDSLHDDYLKALGSVTMWQRSGNEMSLTYDNGAARFRMP